MAVILVTGGKGFLGRHLTSRLQTLGHDVRVLARQNGQNGEKENHSTSTVWGDIRDLEVVEEAVAGVDVVIHLVSNFRKGGSDKKEAYSINVVGTENVLSASLKLGVKQLIHCSTIGVHGNVRQIPANEATSFNPGDLYQETKLMAEERIWKCRRETSFPVTVIRPISMMGPGDLRMLKLFSLIEKGRFIFLGDGQVLFQPAYVEDVVEGFVLCLGNEKAMGEAFIIGGKEYVSLMELCKLIGEELRVPPPKLRVPLAPALLLAALCEKMCIPLGIEPPLHRRRISFFQNNRAFSIEKARKILGYEPKSTLKDCIHKTAVWYKDQGWL